MRLYRTGRGALLEYDARYYRIEPVDWDALFNHADLLQVLKSTACQKESACRLDAEEILAPIGSQEVWAAGVTYIRSRTARMEEAKQAGGGSFYDRVYAAARPELFFKASAHRVSGPGGWVRIRGDSKWNVPEPEVALAVNSRGDILGYTIGNDMSSRDIEGENPLYLPQAKVYDLCCALGPAIYITSEPLSIETKIGMQIMRHQETIFRGETSWAQMKRQPAELVDYLFRENSFPTGCFLLTGTGIVPPDSFTLQSGDVIAIEIAPLGTLINTVQ